MTSLPLFERGVRDDPERREPSDERRILAVAELDFLLRAAVEDVSAGVLVAGEVTGLREAGSGHAYFTLRDETDDAAIDCVMYRTAPVRSRRLLCEGARVVIVGRATVYAPKGRLQFVADAARPAGRGVLLEALEKLKAKLKAEGLFDRSRKRPLPEDPRVIGVVTSRDGAALHDITKVAFARAPVHVVLARALVQGPDAARSIAASVAMLARHPHVQVIIVGRGGGSQEDLRAFNDETLVRKLAECPIPIVSAVGHEVDVTLTDLVADVRAATPSNAAEIVVADVSAKLAALAQIQSRLVRSMQQRLGQARQGLDDAESAIAFAAARAVSSRRSSLAVLERRLHHRHPSVVARNSRAEIAGLEAKLRGIVRQRLTRKHTEVVSLAARLNALSPLGVLARGYAIVSDQDGRIVTSPKRVSAKDLAEGDVVRVRLVDSELSARIESIQSTALHPSRNSAPVAEAPVGEREPS